MQERIQTGQHGTYVRSASLIELASRTFHPVTNRPVSRFATSPCSTAHSPASRAPSTCRSATSTLPMTMGLAPSPNSRPHPKRPVRLGQPDSGTAVHRHSIRTQQSVRNHHRFRPERRCQSSTTVRRTTIIIASPSGRSRSVATPVQTEPSGVTGGSRPATTNLSLEQSTCTFGRSSRTTAGRARRLNGPAVPPLVAELAGRGDVSTGRELGTRDSAGHSMRPNQLRVCREVDDDNGR